MQEGLKFTIETLGCKLNFSESSGIATMLEDGGYARVGRDDLFDIYVINTCSVTENADKQNRASIRRARKLNPGCFVVVTGCYAQLRPNEIAELEGVNLVLGAGEKFNIVEHIEANYGRASGLVKAGKITAVKEFISSRSFGDRTRVFLKVQDGCDYCCSFCTIPLARGRSRSPEINSVLDQIKSIEASGAREIVLTGINIGDFGAGRSDRFYDLLKAIDDSHCTARIRISSVEPDLLNDEIIDLVAASTKFMPHFHIPLQSGCDDVLLRMRRKYDSARYKSRIEKIRDTMPWACIGADVITGFPGESEVEFSQSLDFIQSLDLSYLHVFTYSERANTIASRREDRVPVEIRRQRNKTLHVLSEKMKAAFYKSFQNSCREVLFESQEGGYISGFSDNYIRVRMPAGSVEDNSLHRVLIGESGVECIASGILASALIPA